MILAAGDIGLLSTDINDFVQRLLELSLNKPFPKLQHLTLQSAKPLSFSKRLDAALRRKELPATVVAHKGISDKIPRPLDFFASSKWQLNDSAYS